jgi:hypothetical protein
MRRFLKSFALFGVLASGCNAGSSPRGEEVKQSTNAVNSTPQASRPQRQAKKESRQGNEELDVIARAYEASRQSSRLTGRPEYDAVDKITRAIRGSLELGPTLIVWIVDRTPSAEKLVTESLEAAKAYYESAEGTAAQGANDNLLSAIVAFDQNVEFVLDPPTSDQQKIKAGLNAIRPAASGREQPFTAIKQALEKYLPLRTQQRREVLLVVVTDEAGSDANLVDELAATLRRTAIPLYVIGLPAPWGQVNPFSPNPKSSEPSLADDSVPTVGPESLFSERVDLEPWSPGSQVDLVDSGFGPFALERLCRASRGQFFAIRPEAGAADYAYAGMKYQYWPPGFELRFEDNAAAKYAPDYVAEAEYRKLLSENKARAALHEAAKLPKVVIEGRPLTRFPKETEAKMAKTSSQAQQFAARNSPAVDQLYSALAQGEADREQLTSPRWRAQFDLAMGRVLAAKVRLDGYNSMIAALKRGKTFTNSESTAWILEPADAFETESTIRRQAERAKMYLSRVVQEHPRTPWAQIAEEELKTPLGWTWKEELAGLARSARPSFPAPLPK